MPHFTGRSRWPPARSDSIRVVARRAGGDGSRELRAKLGADSYRTMELHSRLAGAGEISSQLVSPLLGLGPARNKFCRWNDRGFNLSSLRVVTETWTPGSAHESINFSFQTDEFVQYV